MNPTTTDEDLLSIWNRAWAESPSPDPGVFLSRHPKADWGSVVAVLCLDQRRRWERGERRPAAAYVAARPELAADREALLDLLYNEYVLRREAGETPMPDSLGSSYPEVLPLLRRQIEVDSLLNWDDPVTPSETIDNAGAHAIKSGHPSTIGRYPILSIVGAGGQAIVYRALHPTLNREVIVKLCRAAANSAARATLVAEGRLLADLDHPHLVRVLDLDFQDDHPFIVMDYIRGQSLHQAGGGRRYSPLEAARLVSDLALAADYAHRRGAVHRDIKPRNILIDEQGRARLIDFGIARAQSGWQNEDLESGMISGTVEYMAPEQAAGDEEHVGPRSDVFGLGGVLFFLLTGKAPLAGGNIGECLAKARRGAWDAEALQQPGIPARLANVCRRAMARDAADRYASAADLAADLDRFTRLPRRRLWTAAAFVVATIIVAGWFAAWKWKPRPQVQPVPPAVAMPKGSLRVGVWNKAQGRYLDLPGAALATGSRIRMEAGVPPGVPAALFYLDSAGNLDLLATTDSATEPVTLRFPTNPKESATVKGRPGTEIALLVIGATRAPTLDEIRSALGEPSPWPVLPDVSVLRLTGRTVVVEEQGRDFNVTEQDDPEGHVIARLKELGMKLSGQFDEVHALAFKHRE